MEIENSVNLKPDLEGQVSEYVLSLHDVGDSTKEEYAVCLNAFTNYLAGKGIGRFEDVTKKDLGLFLSTKNSQNTRNLYIFVIKNFYKNCLDARDLVEHLHQKPVEETITPSELLTLEEVIALANEAGKRRDMNKVIILTLFESCARINELLNLRVGDVVFASVTDKEGNRGLKATLHFKKSKGNIKKPSVVLTMFAPELKRWVENHPSKKDKLAFLFPSLRKKAKHVDYSNIFTVIANAGERLGIKKRVNPHWFRHSGLSYFANSLNYNEQLLMWRAGWASTQMAKRYIHSGAELEEKAYLERMGYVVEEEAEVKIMPKPCPNCNALNPYTNNNCDFCAMPLDVEKYKVEVKKRRNVERLLGNMNRICSGKLSESQQSQLNKHCETVEKLIELGRKDLATYYMRLLLGSWAKLFITT